MRCRRPVPGLPFVWLLLVLGLPPQPAHAYLDPASGSLLLQLVVGGVAGLALLVRLFWHRLLTYLGIRKRGDGPAES